MLLLITTFITAFAIEALGTLVSVIGLSLLFGANPIIIALAIALDVNKIINVTLLYGRWRDLGHLMRGYALVATVVTMIITSAGAYSFLTGEFQKAMLGSQEGAIQVATLKDQQVKYEARKKQIDDQIARVPDTMSARDRTRIIANFKVEQRDLQVKIAEIDKQLPAMQVKQLSVEAKTGPIITISKTFNISPEEAIKWVILTIIFVFDPLAVFDIVAGNFLLAEWRKKRGSGKSDVQPTSVEAPSHDVAEIQQAAHDVKIEDPEINPQPPAIEEAPAATVEEPQAAPNLVEEEVVAPTKEIIDETSEMQRWSRQKRLPAQRPLLEPDDLAIPTDVELSENDKRERITLETLKVTGDQTRGVLRPTEP